MCTEIERIAGGEIGFGEPMNKLNTEHSSRYQHWTNPYLEQAPVLSANCSLKLQLIACHACPIVPPGDAVLRSLQYTRGPEIHALFSPIFLFFKNKLISRLPEEIKNDRRRAWLLSCSWTPDSILFKWECDFGCCVTCVSKSDMYYCISNGKDLGKRTPRVDEDLR